MKKTVLSCLLIFVGCVNTNTVNPVFRPVIENKIDLGSALAQNAGNSKNENDSSSAIVKQQMKPNSKPIVQKVIVNPTQMINLDDILTLKVISFDADGDVLRFNWTSTKGILSSNQGELVTWQPRKGDGSFEKGIATVSVTLTDDKGGIDTATVNITISSDGFASANQGEAGTIPSSTNTSPTLSTPQFSEQVPSSSPQLPRFSDSSGILNNNQVDFTIVNKIIQQRCLICHSGSDARAGVTFESQEQIKKYVDRIKVRVIDSKSMPQGNATNMTDDERNQINSWISQGASL